MELLTPNTAKTKLEQNTDSQETMNILTGNQQERYIIERNEGKKVGKDEKKGVKDEKKEVNSVIENCERQSQTDTDRLAMEQIVFESFGEEIDAKDNKSLEEKPFIQMEEKQLSESSLAVTTGCNELKETTNENADLIAKDMLSFAWQIARGMVSDDQSI